MEETHRLEFKKFADADYVADYLKDCANWKVEIERVLNGIGH